MGWWVGLREAGRQADRQAGRGDRGQGVDREGVGR